MARAAAAVGVRRLTAWQPPAALLCELLVGAAAGGVAPRYPSVHPHPPTPTCNIHRQDNACDHHVHRADDVAEG